MPHLVYRLSKSSFVRFHPASRHCNPKPRLIAFILDRTIACTQKFQSKEQSYADRSVGFKPLFEPLVVSGAWNLFRYRKAVKRSRDTKTERTNEESQIGGFYSTRI